MILLTRYVFYYILKLYKQRQMKRFDRILKTSQKHKRSTNQDQTREKSSKSSRSKLKGKFILLNSINTHYTIELINESGEIIKMMVNNNGIKVNCSKNEQELKSINANNRLIRIDLPGIHQVQLIEPSNIETQGKIRFYTNQAQLIKDNSQNIRNIQHFSVSMNLLTKKVAIVQHNSSNRLLRKKAFENKSIELKKQKLFSVRSKIKSVHMSKQLKRQVQSRDSSQRASLIKSKDQSKLLIRQVETSDTERSAAKRIVFSRKPLQIRSIIDNKIKQLKFFNETIDCQQNKGRNKRFYEVIPLPNDEIQRKRQRFDSQYVRKRNNIKLNPIEPLSMENNESEVTQQIQRDSKIDYSEFLDTFSKELQRQQDGEDSGTLCESVFE